MTNWRKYNGAIMPTLPPHVDVKETIDDISSFLITSNAYFARWTTNFDCLINNFISSSVLFIGK